MQATHTPVGLKRRFGLFQCVIIIVGIITGTGIYVAPTGIFLRISSPGLALILWPIGGAISLLSSLVFAELGTTYPECGDAYLYLRIFYGELVSFVEFWQYFFFARTGYNAIKCLLAASWVWALELCIRQWLYGVCAFYASCYCNSPERHYVIIIMFVSLGCRGGFNLRLRVQLVYLNGENFLTSLGCYQIECKINRMNKLCMCGTRSFKKIKK